MAINLKQKDKEHKKKILIVITRGEMGGAQKYVRDLAGTLKNEYAITIATDAKGESIRSWAEENKIRVFPLADLKRELLFGFLPSMADWRVFRNLSRHIKDEQYNIVHLNSSKIGFVGSIAARAAGSPKVVFTAHGWVFNEPRSIRQKSWFWVALSRFAAHFQDFIICVSQYDLDAALKKHIAPPKKLFAIANGINAKILSAYPKARTREFLNKKTNALPETKILGTLANHYPTKDLVTMIQGVGYLRDRDVRLVIFGDGPERPLLERTIRERALGHRVFLLGSVEKAEKYLKSLDIYLVSSVKEGMPFSVLEAMAAGIPIISTRVGGLAELLFSDPDQPCALEFNPKNTTELASRITHLLDNPEHAQTLAQNAKARVKNEYSLEETIEKTKWIYEFN